MTSLAESEGARRARHFCALERRLFEVLGGWVPSAPEPEVKLLLRAHSFQHAWHGELWAGLLPLSASAEAPVAGGVGKGPGVLNALAEEAENAKEVTDSVERLAGVYRVVLPRLVTTYAGWRQRMCEPSDGPVARVLSLVLADAGEAWRAGEALLEGLLVGAGDAERAAARADALEGRLVAEGGLDVSERA